MSTTSYPEESLNPLRRLGPGLLVVLLTVGLALLGLTVLLSIGQATANANAFAIKQAVWLVLGLIACVTTALIDLEKLRSWAPVIGVGVIVMLVLVLIPEIGHKVNGARRWIRFSALGLSLQVSDFAKVGLVFVVAHHLASEHRHKLTFWRGFALPLLFIGLITGLILIQPDYGTAALVAVVGGSMLFLAGTRLFYLVPTALLGGGLFGWAIYHDPVRWRRIMSFLYLEENKADSAYQLWQGILAFGVGGVRGVGLGNGRQQMDFLPEAQTDFILPIIGEELGLIFTAGVSLAFLAIFALGFWNLRRAPNLFQFLVAAGALLFLTLQALINICVVTGLVPTKGMSLPFVSYGGSNMLAMFILVGLLLNGFGRWRHPVYQRPLEL